MLFSSIHPKRYVWDFWYWHDLETGIYHLLYLNAPPELVAEEQHHFQARIGYATTHDFKSFTWVKDDVFTADHKGWDNTSIWSGDVIAVKDGFVLFYTSRNQQTDDGMTQNVGAAISKDFIHWERVPDFRLQPDPKWYEPRKAAGEITAPAWRDPYLFRHNGALWMVLAAKSKNCEPRRKGAIGLLKSKDGSLFNWEIQPPMWDPGWYDEMEVPQVYLNAQNEPVVIYSSWSKYDHAPNTHAAGGLHELPAIFDQDDNARKTAEPHIILPESAGIYAARIIPEMQGEVVGFSVQGGSHKKSGLKTGYKHPNRDFKDIMVFE